MGRMVLACIAIAFALPGCGKELESAPLPELYHAEVGERCASRRDACSEDGNVLYCEDGHWTLRDCEAECEDAEWFGCLLVDFDVYCKCGEGGDPWEPPPAPTPPIDACLDAQTLQLCDYSGDCIVHDCATVCSETDRTSAGCFETAEGSACHCTFAGSACDEGTASRCDGLTSLATCIDGMWSLALCEIDCPDALQPGCRLADDGTSACVCVEA